LKVARFFTDLENKRVQCFLCPHRCIIAEGRNGTCRVRKDDGGVLYAQTYGKISSFALDPVEKKPLYHFYPGRNIFSVGSVGCNLHCSFCQNWSISQTNPDNFSLREISPEDLARRAQRDGSIGLSYTYNEPFIWWEFVYDTAQLIRKEGLKNVLVTNGYVEEEPLRELLPWIDAMNVDLKSMDDDFYRRYCGGTLQPVLKTIEISVREGTHVEITNLIIPGLNDRWDLIEKLVSWIYDLNPSIPLHFSRYFPTYKLDNPPTPVSFLEEVYHFARERLPFVYLGNIGGGKGNITFCPTCRREVVIRRGYQVDTSGLLGNRCRFCGSSLPFYHET